MGWLDIEKRLLGRCTRVFGEDVTYQPVAGGSVVVRGIYNALHRQVDEEGIVVESVRPNLGVRLDDLPGAPITGPNGDTVVVRGNTFRFSAVEEDGEGGATLFLERTT